jgi:hypothetical protein
MNNAFDFHDEDDEEAANLPLHQQIFGGLLQQYSGDFAPLESWMTDDLIKLMDSIDRELQSRGERISSPSVLPLAYADDDENDENDEGTDWV